MTRRALRVGDVCRSIRRSPEDWKIAGTQLAHVSGVSINTMAHIRSSSRYQFGLKWNGHDLAISSRGRLRLWRVYHWWIRYHAADAMGLHIVAKPVRDRGSWLASEAHRVNQNINEAKRIVAAARGDATDLG